MDRIKVCVRIRPLLRVDSETGEQESEVAWKWSDQHIVQDKFLNPAQAAAAAAAIASSQGRDKESLFAYSFDNLFGPEASNAEVYIPAVKGLVTKTMQGFHGSVFSYGQTCSGNEFLPRIYY